MSWRISSVRLIISHLSNHPWRRQWTDSHLGHGGTLELPDKSYPTGCPREVAGNRSQLQRDRPARRRWRFPVALILKGTSSGGASRCTERSPASQVESRKAQYNLSESRPLVALLPIPENRAFVQW